MIDRAIFHTSIADMSPLPHAFLLASIVDPCCWLGVTCKTVAGGQVRVTELNLAYNNLRGSLPNTISNMQYLAKL